MSASKKKKTTSRKRSGVYPYPPIALIQNGVKYKAGCKPARVCSAAAVNSRPLSATERFLAEALAHTAEDLRRLRDDLGRFDGGRPAGSMSASTKYVRKLRADNPTLHWKELLRVADPKKIGSMSEGRFRNVAGGARRK